MHLLSRRGLIDRLDSKPFDVAWLESLGNQPRGFILIVAERVPGLAGK